MVNSNELSLESVRDSLTGQEDSIVFSLIERSNFPLNPKAYDPWDQFGAASFAHFFVRESETLQAKGGRYQNPEEMPFFPDNLPSPLLPPHDYPKIFHPASASVCVNKDIWDMYFNELLPLITSKGDDGNYAATVTSDIVCLQDKDALMKLLTFEKVEEMVKRRVAKKAMVFGQNVTLEEKADNGDNAKSYKVDPCVVSRLYNDWVMPLTKLVEVEYLLRRLE